MLIGDGRGHLEVGIAGHEIVIDALVHRPEHRVTFANEDESTGAQQVVDHLSPAAHIGQPAQGADAGEDEVESLAAQGLDRGVHIGLDEVDFGTGLSGQCACLGQRLTGEVQARHVRAPSSQGDRVRADVALQVHSLESGDLPEQGNVEAHDIAEVCRILMEVLDLVAVGARVGGCPLVPRGEVVAVVAGVDDAGPAARTLLCA